MVTTRLSSSPPCKTKWIGDGFVAWSKEGFQEIANRIPRYINPSRGICFIQKNMLNATMVVSVSNFTVLMKPQFWEPENLVFWQWRNLVGSIKMQLNTTVSFRISQRIRINKQNSWKMLRMWYAIWKFSRFSQCSWYQFKVFLLMLMTGTRSESPKEAIGMKVEAWISL